MSTQRFGVSTHLFHASRLDRSHLVEIAAHDFEAVEVFATRTHFDYHDEAAAAALAEWLDDTRLVLNSIHAPIAAGLTGGVWSEGYSTAAASHERRERAVAEIRAAIALAARVPYRYLVVHLGVPVIGDGPPAGDNAAEAVRRSLQEIHAAAREVGVTLALEVIPNPLSTPEALVRRIEEDPDLPGTGICLDTGHAFIGGDLVEAIETCSGHLVTTHLHDNHGRADEHLVPFDGGIDWPGALLAMQKVGYDGTWMFEVADTGDPAAVMARTARARDRFAKELEWR